MLILPGCTVVLLSQCFDERPLNQSAYTHESKLGTREVSVRGALLPDDGGQPQPITAAMCETLVTQKWHHEAMAKAVFINRTMETSSSTLDGRLVFNTNTSYEHGSADHQMVCDRLSQRRAELSSRCLECLLSGCKICVRSDTEHGPCSRCVAMGLECVYAASVLDFSDQGGEQRKGLAKLHLEHVQSPTALACPDYQQVAFGALHALKNTVGSMRNYRIGDASGEVCITMLRAIACSKTDLGLALCAAIRSDVLLLRDRHADEMSYLTVWQPVQEVLAACVHGVKYSIVHDPYITWHARVAEHRLLERPGCLVANSRGELLVTDLANRVIFMVTRSVPAKVKVVAGEWNQPGILSEGRISTPVQLVLFVEAAGRKEYCLFADSGNCAICCLTGAPSFDADHEVQPITIHGLTESYMQPYGLALLQDGRLAISEDLRKRIVITTLNMTARAATVALVLSHHQLSAPRQMATLENRLYVVDEKAVRGVVLASGGGIRGSWQVLRQSFEAPRGIAVLRASDEAGHHIVAVSDTRKHQIFKLTVKGLKVLSVKVMGDGRTGHFDGPVEASSFPEPSGLAFSDGVLAVSCLGGGKHGAVCIISPNSFALKLLKAIESGYHAIGYVLPSAKPEERSNRHKPLEEAIGMYRQFVDTCDALCSYRSQLLGGRQGVEGPDGCMCWHSVRGHVISLESVTQLAADLRATRVSNLHRVTLYALLNESRVEYSFGHYVIMTQSANPTMREYAGFKAKSFRHDVNYFCETAFSWGISGNSNYQRPEQQVGVMAEHVMQLAETVFKLFHPLARRPSLAERTALEASKARCRIVVAFARPQRCQTVRTKYMASGFYRPTILLVDPDEDEPTAQRILAFDSALADLRRDQEERAGQVTTERQQQRLPVRLEARRDRSLYWYVEGDFYFVLAGECQDNPGVWDTARREEWWAVQATRALLKSHAAAHPRCFTYGFWLNKRGRHGWVLLSSSEVSLRFDNLLKSSGGEPVILTTAELPAGWRGNGDIVFKVPQETSDQLDEIVTVLQREGEGGVSSSDDGEDGSSGDEADRIPAVTQPTARDARAQRTTAEGRQLALCATLQHSGT